MICCLLSAICYLVPGAGVLHRSAMEFILSASSEDLSMDAAEFEAQLLQATAELDGTE